MGEPSTKRARTKRSSSKKPSDSEIDVFFSQEQKAPRFASFMGRKLEKHKLIDLTWFLENGFFFPRLLIDQHLELFCNMKGNIYPRLVKEFYANLVKRDEKWVTEVQSSRISVNLSTLEQIGGLQNLGELFFDISQIDWESVNPINTFLRLVRPGKHYDGKLMGAGLLEVNDRLLHYVIVYILVPRLFNKAQLNAEDLKFMHALKNKVQVNWANVIWGHMLRRHKDPNGVLPYPALVSRIIVDAGVDVTSEAKLSLRERADKIDSLTLNKLKITRVDGIWKWLEDPQPNVQNKEAEIEEEMETDTPVPSQASNPSLKEAMDQIQGFMMEQISLIRADMNIQNRKIENLEDKVENVFTLVKSLVASKEKDSSSHPPPSES